MTHQKEWPGYRGSAPSLEQSRQAQGSSGHGGLLPGRQFVLQICIMWELVRPLRQVGSWVRRNPLGLFHLGEGEGQEDPTRD